MTEKISLGDGEFDKNKTIHPCPNCEDIVGKFIIASIIFWLTAFYFADTLFDIKGYIEDHGLEYQYIEIFMILLLLFTFYFISKLLMELVLYLYNLLFSQNKCDDNGDILLGFSILSSVLYIIIAANYFASVLAPSGGVQEEMLKNTIGWWLVCILIINILINSNRFQQMCIAWISNKICKLVIFITRKILGLVRIGGDRNEQR